MVVESHVPYSLYDIKPSIHMKRNMNAIAKKIYSFVLVCVLSMAITSCTTSKSVVSQNVDLSKYRYASVINNDTYHIPAQLMEYEIMLFDAVEASRLQLVSDMRLYELTQEQQSKLLIVKYGVNIQTEETVVTVNFIDFLSGRPVALCRGAYSTLGFSSSADIKGAITRAAEQISQTFPKM